MSWRRVLDLARFFWWTEAARGIRDGRRGLPRDDHWVAVEQHGHPVPAPTAVLAQALGSNGGLPAAVYAPVAHGPAPGAAPLPVAAPAVGGTGALELQARPEAPQDGYGTAPAGPWACAAFHEAELVSIAELKIARVLEEWEAKKHPLEARAKRARFFLEARLREIAAAHRRHAHMKLRRPQHSPRWLYYAAITAISFIDFWFNAGGFAILRVDEIEQLVYALGPSLAILFPLHYLGRTLRQWNSASMGRWAKVALSAVCAACLVALPLAIGILRGKYVEWATGSASTWQTVTLIIINLTLFGAAVVAAFFAHDADAELEASVREVRRYERRVYTAWGPWIRWATRLDTLQGGIRTRLEAIHAETRAQVLEYRAFVARSRPDGKVPAFFHTLVTDALFRPRDLGSEIDRIPRSLDEVLATLRHPEEKMETA